MRTNVYVSDDCVSCVDNVIRTENLEKEAVTMLELVTPGRAT